MIWLLTGAALLGGLVVVAVLRVRAYGRILARDSFSEIYQRLIETLRQAEQGDEAAREAPHSFVSSTGIAMVARLGSADGQRTLQLSISQADRMTTPVVAQRVAFFALAVLHDNAMELTPFYTRSGVHHLRCVGIASPMVFVPFDEAFATYDNHYKPLPFMPASHVDGGGAAES